MGRGRTKRTVAASTIGLGAIGASSSEVLCSGDSGTPTTEAYDARDNELDEEHVSVTIPLG